MELATLFIDESGKASLAEKQNEPFILTGVVLDDNDKQIIEGFFGYIKLKYGIKTNEPFHSYDIYENPKSKLTDNQLKSLSEKLGEFISLIPIDIYIYKIDKNIFKDSIGVKSLEDLKGSAEKKEIRDYPYRILATKLFIKFGKYLESKNKIGQIVADSRRGADYQMIKTLSMLKEGAFPLENGIHILIKNRLNAITFADKGYLSGGIEITDLISYTSFVRARKLITSMSNTGINKVWSQIKAKTKVITLTEKEIRNFFSIKKGEVHKHLK